MNKLIMLFAAGLSFNCFSATELKGSPEELKAFLHPNENIITITREAKEAAFKDIAIVSINVTTEDDKLSLALNKNSALRAEISSILVEKGILIKNINNAKFSTSPDYGWFGDKPNSYKVSNVIAIRIHDESGLESIAGIVDQYKTVSLLKTDYEHAKKDEFIEKVKTKALDNVLKEKEFYSKKLGIKLKAVSFRDNNANPQNDVEVIEVRGLRTNLSKAAYSPKVQPSFEKVIYKAKVSVSFKVE